LIAAPTLMALAAANPVKSRDSATTVKMMKICCPIFLFICSFLLFSWQKKGREVIHGQKKAVGAISVCPRLIIIISGHERFGQTSSKKP